MSKFERSVLDFLTKPIVAFWSLGWLMVLLITGTIAQRYIGLYQAQNKFFSSFFFWFGWIPLPGAYSVLGILFLGLLLKLLFRSPWKRQNLGIIVTHMGALALLFGGFLTAAFSHEGAMAIPEGATVGYISDYNDVELAILDPGTPDAPAIATFKKAELNSGKVLSSKKIPFRLQLLQYGRNCSVFRRQKPAASADGPLHGFAVNFDVQPAPLQKESEQNQACAGFRLTANGDSAPNGVYSIFEGMPILQTVSVNGRKFGLALRPARTTLPFAIKLIKFTRTMHPGTDIPASYQSEVMLLDGSIKQRIIIQMNEPLHYKGYTLYQASFMEGGGNDPEAQTTVLAVVHNIGRVFPYISSLMMCIGLLLHMALQLPKLIQRQAER